ncbi:MAG TPA: polysaccharide biosynthesis/export family protein [Xanthobacteraceae bacterium]|nr:polysaccharide biosynthesis/export family protein [Xanthobacteraceae bacterium]
MRQAERLMLLGVVLLLAACGRNTQLAYRPYVASAPVYAQALPAPQPAYAQPVYTQPAYAPARPVAVAQTTYMGAAYPTTPQAVPEGPYTLDSGDRLRVVVFGQEGLTTSYSIDASGNIQMPLIGTVPARGLTTQQLAGQIAARLKQGFIREPHVAVEVEVYRPFFILGEVTYPGQYPYVANMSVETAVAIAGGFSPRAKRNVVELSRPYMGQIVKGTVPVHTKVRPGDTISVAERWF